MCEVELLSTADVAKELGVIQRRVNLLIQLGRIRAEKVGHQYVITRKALDEFIESREETKKEPAATE